MRQEHDMNERKERNGLFSYLIIFIAAAVPFFETFTVVPLGIIGGLSPVLVAVTAFVGNALTVLLLVVFVDRLKKWRDAKKNRESESRRSERAKRLFDRYGLPGLALIGPFFVGSHLSALAAMSFGSERKRVAAWMLFSVGAWTAVMAIAAGAGISYFMPHVDNGPLTDLFRDS
jgi:Ca2+/H+ antiporter, TMEM165/GDT1 family